MTTTAYYYSGSVIAWTVPANVDTATPVSVVLVGGSGGGAAGGGAVGLGGLVSGDLTAVAGQNWYLSAGGAGAGGGGGGAGGWNGGGKGGGPGGGGGGASDIRIANTTLTARVVVAGGGSGGGSGGGGSGFAGGGLTGSSGTTGFGDGGGGTQSAGGGAGARTGSTSGFAGASGVGAPGVVAGGSGGGSGGAGGGYYGGGSGAASNTTPSNTGGSGGGSSYVGGLSGVVVNTQGYAGAPQLGGYGFISITYNLIPNAPTLLSPLAGAFVDQGVNLTARWLFSDDDPGDTQSAYELQYRIGTASWVTTGTVTSAAGQAVIPTATLFPLSGQLIEWQVRTTDSHGAVGPWSASGFFIPVPAPASFVYAPTLATIISQEQTVSGARSDSGPMDQYQVQAVNDVSGAAGTTVLADTGVVTLTGSPTSLSASIPAAGFVNGDVYHILTRIASPVGVWQHTATDTGPLIAEIAPPAVALLVLTFLPDSAAVQITITNPTPTDPDLAVVSNDLIRIVGGVRTRIATGLAPNATFPDPIPPGNLAGLDVEYEAIAYTATGAAAGSGGVPLTGYGSGGYGAGTYGT